MSENTNTVILLDEHGNIEATAAALVYYIRASVNGQGKYADYVAAHNVTRETVKFHAAALATITYPSDEPVQKKDGKRTRYGNAVQAAGNGLRAALGKADSTTETDWIKKILTDCEKATDNGVDAGAVADAVQTWIASVLS